MKYIKYNFFQLEKLRDTMAKNRQYNLLKATYAEKTEIPNTNTGELWDYKNEINYNLKKQNPMAYYRIKKVSEYITGDDLSILDLGFGPALIENRLVKIKSKIKNLTGIDISKRSVDLARKNFPEWTFKAGEIVNNRLGNCKFDYVLALEVLEHISPKYILSLESKIYKSLKNNGYFLLSVPLNEGLEEMIAKGINPNAHTRVYTPDLIQAELKLNHFRIIDTKYLYAFNNFYLLKSIVVRYFHNFRKPNNIIILAQKS